MSTPTEPTTPQQPADATGLLPCPFCGRKAVHNHNDHEVRCSHDESPLCPGAFGFVSLDLWNRRTPTPHAEAGVRDEEWAVKAAKEILLLAEVDSFSLPETTCFHATTIAEIIAKHAPSPVRHRPAAETVGAGWMPIETAPKDGTEIRVRWKYHRSDFVECRTIAAFKNGKWVCGNWACCYPDEWQPITATPPATQSALEQAREALWEYRVAAIADVKSAARWNSGEADMAEIRATEARLKKADKQVDAALAALNAVLTPAKGGAAALEPLAPVAGYTIPQFSGKRLPEKHKFTWWGWHPNYAYWSKSCWGAATQEAAMNLRGHLDLYAVALVMQEGDDLRAIYQEGPKRPEVWEKIAAQQAAQPHPATQEETK